MADRDELLFGAEPVAEPAVAPDSDGDGVSDLQERLDGTDPNDASSSIRHADPTLATVDPRGDVMQASLEGQIVVDVTSGAPPGFSTEQSLGTGLDGKPIQADPNHLGIGDDKLLAGRVDSNSLAGVERDPMLKGGTTTPKDAHAAMIETMGREPGPGVSTGPVIRGGFGDDPPPGETPSGSADPDHNPELVSGFVADGARAVGHLAGAASRELQIIAHDVINAPKTYWDAFVQSATEPEDTPPPPKPDPPTKSVDPDAAGGSTVVVTEEDIARAITARDGATDVVQGFGGTQIEGDAPPKQAIDFVRDPIEKDSTLAVGTTTAPTTPGQEISHTINPDAGFDVPRGTSAGGSSGGGGDPSLYGTTSSAATAVDSTADSASSGISVVGSGSGGSGIQTVAGDDATTDPGRASQSSAMMAASGPGTQTEDEVYIGKTSAPAGGAAGAAAGGPAGAAGAAAGGAAGAAGAAAGGAAGAAGGAPADPILGLAPSAVGAAGASSGSGGAAGAAAHDGAEAGKAFDAGQAGEETSKSDSEIAAGGAAHDAGADAPMPTDPVADAMVTSMHAVPLDELAPTFAVLEVDDGLAVPDEADLDDGF